MHQLSSLLINQDVLDVSVAQTNNVADYQHNREKMLSEYFSVPENDFISIQIY